MSIEGYNDVYVDQFYDVEPIYYEETLDDVTENCIVPSLTSISPLLVKLLCSNLWFGVLVSCLAGKLPETVFHFMSGTCGIYLITTLPSLQGQVIIVGFFILSYFFLGITFAVQRYIRPVLKTYFCSSNLVKYGLIALSILCQYTLLDQDTWMEIRGTVMIFSMKIISITDDIEKGSVPFPKFHQFFGYILCGANVLFGPWITYQEYTLMFQQPPKKNIVWIANIVRALIMSLFFLTLSNCWTSYLVPDNAGVLFVSYREALSFRTSHYFISYLSEASMLAAGYKHSRIWNNEKEWRYMITDPTKIEFPTALSIVVTNWNKPMHDFLKKYVYKSWLPVGRLPAVLMTFCISSFLHGFEKKVSVVLLSLGVFSYLQYSVRDYVSRAFDACVRVYPCSKECKHKLKRNNIRSRMLQMFFSLTTVLHLIFLGVLMDSSTDDIGVYSKWRSLYFYSIWIVLVDLIIVM